MSKTSYQFIAEDSDLGVRLDRFLAAHLPEMSRARVQALISDGHVTRNGAIITDSSAKVKPQQHFVISVPDLAPSHIEAQAIALDINYEDDDMLVINKPPGMTVHPAPGNRDGTLVNALLAHCGATLSGIGGVARPGIVHRIDKDTSGLLVVAKHDVAHAALSAQLADRSLKRSYLALVWGTPKNKSGTITGNIGRSPSNRKKMAVVKSGGKHAVTHYKLLEDFGIASLLECQLETGRTHQIRVHLTHIGHPLVGDPVYGQTAKSRLNANVYKSLKPALREALLAFNRQALHAKQLELIHPKSKKKLRFESALAPDMEQLLEVLTNSN